MDLSQRKRVVMCILICCSIMLFVSLYYKSNRKSSDSKTGKVNDKVVDIAKRTKRSKLRRFFKYSKVCATKKCRQFGNQFQRIINISVDPCDDFYEFACGRFQQNEKITADLTTIRTAETNVWQTLRNDLNQPINSSDPMSVRYAINMFKGCVDSNTLESRGVEPLVTALNTIGGWPLIGQKSTFDSRQYNPFDGMAKITALFALNGIVEVVVSPDIIDNSRYTINFMSSPDLFSTDNMFENIVNRGRTAPNQSPRPKPKMKPISEINKNAKQSHFEQYDFILQKVLLMGGTDNQNTRQQIIDLVDFSLKLIEVQQSPANQDSTSNITLTFKQFNELSSNRIDWLRFGNKIYSLLNSSQKFTQDDICIVSEPEYFRQLPEILSKTSNEVIANFLGLKLVSWFGDYTIQAFKDLDYGNLTPSWIICVDLLQNNMGFALSRKYVEKHFSLSAKIEASNLVDYIQDAFYDLLSTNKIFEEYSRNRSLIKLKDMTKNVGYPDWLFDDKTLDSNYDLQKECNKNMLFQCIVYLMRRKMFITFDSINKAVNFTINSWNSDLTDVDAVYMLNYNSITITAAIIKEFLASDNPGQINYARLGPVIGHEMTHGFDPDGSLFNEKGNFDPIWDIITQNRFDEREQCFVDEYNKFCEPLFCVDGQNTLNENIADNGGVREAYKAYKMYNLYKEESMRLPYVSQYTTDQIFFMSYATLWCDNMSPEETANFAATDVHSPSKYRVNGVLANMYSFAKAFDCPINSSMNPSNKCVLW